jgi:hypothetical protein
MDQKIETAEHRAKLRECAERLGARLGRSQASTFSPTWPQMGSWLGGFGAAWL